MKFNKQKYNNDDQIYIMLCGNCQKRFEAFENDCTNKLQCPFCKSYNVYIVNQVRM